MNGAPYLSNAGAFLVQAAFGFYLLALMLRLLLQWVRADFYNPLVQFLVRITNPPLVPLRRIIPGLAGVDLAAVVLLLALQLLEFFLAYPLAGLTPKFPGIVLLAVAELLRLLFNVWFWAVIIQAILSWVAPRPGHPIASLLRQLTAPLLRPAQRLLPPMGGLDLSPVLVLIGLQLLQMVLVAPLRDMGLAWGLG